MKDPACKRCHDRDVDCLSEGDCVHKYCIMCAYHTQKFFFFHRCSSPELCNPVTGMIKMSCQAARRFSYNCGSSGRLFKFKGKT